LHQGDRRGLALTYLFLGNTNGKLGRHQLAERWYKRSLELDEEYARARIGLAEVHYHLASGQGTCVRRQADVPGLNQAAAEFEQSRRAGNRPELSDIDTKIALGLGRTWVCLSRAGLVDRWAAAREQLAVVLKDLAAGNERVRELAARAHAQLGMIEDPAAGASDAAGYGVALDHYRQAVAISRDPRSRWAFFLRLEHIYRQLGDPAAAQEAAAQASKLATELSRTTTTREPRR
jgi:tetratricopeptide (TPR) repeat protein